MADTLKLPDKTRIRLHTLWLNAQPAQAIVDKFQHAMTTAIEMLDLDPALNHQVNWETGIITPAESSARPTLVKEEAAS